MIHDLPELAKCSRCRAIVRIRRDGRLRKHNKWDTHRYEWNPCAGGGEQP